MSEWIEHDGKGMPVDGDTLVYVKFSDGDDDSKCKRPMTASYWRHNWNRPEAPFHGSDIVAYRIHEPTPEARGPRT